MQTARGEVPAGSATQKHFSRGEARVKPSCPSAKDTRAHAAAVWQRMSVHRGLGSRTRTELLRRGGRTYKAWDQPTTADMARPGPHRPSHTPSSQAIRTPPTRLPDQTAPGEPASPLTSSPLSSRAPALPCAQLEEFSASGILHLVQGLNETTLARTLR